MVDEERDEVDRILAWQDHHPKDVVASYASRCALRFVPHLVGIPNVETEPTILVPFFRAVLTSSVASVRPTEEVHTATHSARAAVANSAAAHSASSSAAAAAVAATGISGAAHSTADSAIRSAGKSDEKALEGLVNARDIFRINLWHDANTPVEIAENWQLLRRTLIDADENWNFWIDWYERHLEGRPQNWDLLERIALIPDEEWEKGATHVNAVIMNMQHCAEPEARFEVRSAIAKAESGVGKRFQIGGNFPPEPLSETSEVDHDLIANLTITTSAIETLKHLAIKNGEVAKNALEIAVKALGKAISKLFSYCAKKGDLALDITIKTGVPILLGDAALHGWASALGQLYQKAEIWLSLI